MEGKEKERRASCDLTIICIYMKAQRGLILYVGR